MNNSYDQLKSVIQAANPDLHFECPCSSESCKWFWRGRYRPIRLADVLLALSKELSSGSPEYRDILLELAAPNFTYSWNLKDDNLDHQSDETKQFLTDLLCK